MSGIDISDLDVIVAGIEELKFHIEDLDSSGMLQFKDMVDEMSGVISDMEVQVDKMYSKAMHGHST